MKKISLFLVSVLFIILPIKSFALTATPCEFSQEYQDWLNLTPEEQQVIPMPSICQQKTEFKTYYQTPKLFEEITKASYPTRYDSRNVNGKNYISPVRDQMSTGACWAFAALSTIESYNLKNFSNLEIYSPRHIDYTTSRYFLNGVINPESYNRIVGQGGNGYMASNYFISNKGPILENSMPFEDNENIIDYNDIKNKEVSVDINGYEIIENPSLGCSETIKNQMKKHIMQYGSISTSIFMTVNSRYYRAQSYALNYNSTSAADFFAPNHAVTIVGWDDNFSRNLFATNSIPPTNGAWIVKNSYGTDWSYGNNGYFYISYNDDWVCKNPTGVTDVDRDVEDKIYYHDVLGYNSFYGYNSTKAYGANVFTLESNQELLKEVTFVAKENTDYEIYINPYNSDLNTANFTKIGSGKTTYQGYHTFKLNKPILLENENFVIMVSYELENGAYPIGTQIKSGTLFDKGNTTPKTSFVAQNIEGPWEDLSDEKSYQPYVSIKGSTEQINYNFQLADVVSNPQYPYIEGNYTINIPITGKNIQASDLQVNIYNSQDQNVTQNFKINKQSNQITLSKGDTQLPKGNYRIDVTYYDIERSKTFSLYERYDLLLEPIIENTNMYDSNKNNIDIPINAVGYNDNYELQVTITNSNSNDITSNFTITNKQIKDNRAKIHIEIPAFTESGTYTVTITGEKSIEANFEIIKYIPLESIDITPRYNQLLIDQTQRYTVKFTPSNATNKKITWKVSDPEVGTIENGVVTALKRGELQVTATSVDNPEISKSADLTIIDPNITLTSIVTKGNNNLDSNALFTGSSGEITIKTLSQDVFSSKLNVKILNSGNQPIDYFPIEIGNIIDNQSTIKIKFNGQAPAGVYIVKISSGIAKALDYQFRIYEPIRISDISFDNIRTSQGMTFSLRPDITPANAYNKELKYTIANPQIATVKNNQITTLNPGQTTVTATSTDGSNKKSSFELTVIDKLFLNTKYNIDENYVGNISEKTSYQSFINTLKIDNDETVTIYSKDRRQKITSGYIGTGMILEKKTPTKTYTYFLVVKGDISGDGTIGALDVLRLRRHIVKLETLSIAAQKAADVDDNKNIGALDALKLRRHIVRIEYIK